MINKKAIATGLAILITGMSTITTYAGWQYTGSQWKYENNGTYLTSWQNINAAWYYFDQNGTMMTGWQQINGIWFYFNADGSMALNQWIGNYYVGSNGAMVINSWVGPYYVGNDGKWVPGYQSASNIDSSQGQEEWLTNLDYLTKESIYFKDTMKDNFGTSYQHCFFGGTNGGEIVYYVNSEYSKVKGTIALKYEKRDRASDAVIWTIYADDTEIYMSSPINTGDDPENIDLDIEGCRRLKIKVSGGYQYASNYFFGDIKLYR